MPSRLPLREIISSRIPVASETFRAILFFTKSSGRIYFKAVSKANKNNIKAKKPQIIILAISFFIFTLLEKGLLLGI
jgi:hypothetical protein